MNMLEWLIPAMVFCAVFAFALVFRNRFLGGSDRRLRTRMQQMDGVSSNTDSEKPRSMLREQYLHELSPLERWIEDLPGMGHIEKLCEQTGMHIPAYRVVLLSLGMAVCAGLLLLAFGRPWLALLAFCFVLPLPYLKLAKTRNQRLLHFEEQLPDALDVISRALRAGNPFTETLKVVAQEMDDPLATEFGITFSDLNYGVSIKSAFLGLLERVPTVSLSAMVGAVLVQRETGGNMAEILERIAGVLRQRHRFRRRVRTLSAEGRMSAWVLILMPFLLALLLTIIEPTYLPLLTKDPLGIKLIIAGLIAMTFGVFWIRRIIHIRY